MAGTLVGGAFLSAGLQVLFDRLASREFINLFRERTSNVDGLLKKLKRKLNLLKGLLGDADVKQFTDESVKDWSDDVRDAFYQADDLLSEMAYEALRLKVESDPDYQRDTSSSLVNNILTLSLSSTTTCSFDESVVEAELEDIIQLLEELIEGAGSLGLKEGVGPVHVSTTMYTPESSSLVVESEVYGRDNEKEELIKLLLSEETGNEVVGVIPVVGMGGLGKTTLAGLAYHDGRVVKHFQMRAWACVSQEFDVLRVSKTILESITHRTCSSTNLNQIQETLKEELRGKKFLVVFDDVWNKEYRKWDSFKTPFRTGAPGSKIIVTTRDQNVASIMKTGTSIDLQKLSDKYCWSMFSKIALDRRYPSSSSYPQRFEEIGRKIMKRCGGLPLAVKSLAGLLLSKHDVEEWDDVANCEFWDLPEGESDILPALRLSYHYLSSHSKQCFAFCSLFPKNYKFREKEVVLLWIAHEFVPAQRGKCFEMEGNKCFRELLSMSFFQKCGMKDNESIFVMHDLIHDLAQVVSGDFSFRVDDDKVCEIPIRARHFSFNPKKGDDGLLRLQAAKDVSDLRTFLPVQSYYFEWKSQVKLDAVLSRQKHMRVLSLRTYRSVTNELLDVIGSLINLRYLDLSFTYIAQLPESICKLHNLQTLLLFNCWYLTTLPVEIGKLLSLHRLDVRGTNLKEMPVQMRRLKGLEYLTNFVVGNGSGLGIQGLKELSNLRGALEISGLENIRDSVDALEAAMKDKQHLETLHLEWGSVDDTGSADYEWKVLDCLRPHHSNLKDLTITRYRGTTFPGWLGDALFSQMVSLSLEQCVNCYKLPPLGQLPCLKELNVARLSGVGEVGEEFYGSCAGTYHQPFPSLERLCFEDMSEWEKWLIPGTGEFPKLRELKMINCPKLEGGLPQNTGTTVVKSCSSLEVSVPTLSSSSSSQSSSCSTVAADLYSKELVLSGSEGLKINWEGINKYGLLVKVDISDLPNLNCLTSELCTLTNLKELSVYRCRYLVSLSNTGLPPMLESLDIAHCEVLESVVDGMVSRNTCRLLDLDVASCPSLVSFADNGLPSSLRKVKFVHCPKLEIPHQVSVAEDIQSSSCCSSVESLVLKHSCLGLDLMVLLKLFPNLPSLLIEASCCFLQQGEGGGVVGLLAKLTKIEIRGCKNLKSLPDRMPDLLPLLETLHLRDCLEMESFGEAGLPSSLGSLTIVSCEKLLRCRSGWGLQRLPSLGKLVIERVVLKEEEEESFPEEGLLPSTLRELKIDGFGNMKKLNWRGIQHLTCLIYLRISGCPELESLPDEGLPPSIRRLYISGCPLLKPRCQKHSGQDWAKIAHIPILNIY